MNVLFVLAHPEPGSFNASLVRLGERHLAAKDYQVRISDLYKQGFDPVERGMHYRDRENIEVFSPLAEQRHAWRNDTLAPEISKEITNLEWADLVIFQFPIWWHSMPAMLKGWFDRVFISGGLYNSRMRYDEGYFRGKRAFCSVTSGAPAEVFIRGGRGGELQEILWSTQFSLHYMGFDVLPPHASFGVAGHGYSYVDDETFSKQFETLNQNWLSKLDQIETEKPLSFPGWKDWDELGRPRLKTSKNIKETEKC